jgi:hypothetical protein
LNVTLSYELQSLKDSLLQWLNLNVPDKYKFLTVENDTFVIDNEMLQMYFERQDNKVFITGEKLETYRKIEQLIELLKFFQNTMASH